MTLVPLGPAAALPSSRHQVAVVLPVSHSPRLTSASGGRAILTRMPAVACLCTFSIVLQSAHPAGCGVADVRVCVGPLRPPLLARKLPLVSLRKANCVGRSWHRQSFTAPYLPLYLQPQFSLTPLLNYYAGKFFGCIYFMLSLFPCVARFFCRQRTNRSVLNAYHELFLPLAMAA
jgi:hypothetical protein